MGMFTKMKTATGLEEARKAWEAGHTVWLGRYWDEVLNYQGTGAVSGADHFIMDIERIGWQLYQVTYSWVPEKKRGVTVMLFRRPVERQRHQ